MKHLYLILLLTAGIAHAMDAGPIRRRRVKENAKACVQSLHAPQLPPNDVPAVTWDLAIAKANPQLLETYKKTRHVLLWGEWARAMAKIDQIRAAALDSDPEERKSWERDAKLAEVTLVKHQLMFALDQDPEGLRVGNHRAVLAKIAEFDPEKPRWSLFSIRREVERTHATKEYLNCR